MRIIAIADDFSGAAEIAGLGLRHGLTTRLLREPITRIEEGLTVIDTDSRLMSQEEAGATVIDAISQVDLRSADLIYKKTDSVFRGRIRVELEALLRRHSIRLALLAPQNPSRGRTLRQRTYQVNQTPLHLSAFADDPDHPARTSDAMELLGANGSMPVSYADPEDWGFAWGILICGAWDAGTMARWASRVTENVLPAGSSDFFEAILASRGLRPARPFIDRLPGSRRLFICGSASAYSRELIACSQRCKLPVIAMPDEVFGGGEVVAWAQQICHAIQSSSGALVVITQPLDRMGSASQRLQTALAEVSAAVPSRCPIDHLFLEGGATASAVCKRMNWRSFEVLGELATGVVQLKVDSPTVPSLLVKPGSYRWPDFVWQS